jgi:hypothetical protein
LYFEIGRCGLLSNPYTLNINDIYISLH